MNLILRDKVWDMVSDLVCYPYNKQLVLCTGIKKWEDEIKDIVDSIEELAITLEKHIIEKEVGNG